MTHDVYLKLLYFLPEYFIYDLLYILLQLGNLYFDNKIITILYTPLELFTINRY